MTDSRFKLMLMVVAFITAFALSSAAKAERLTDLYTATWPVASQSSSERAQAIRNSLQQALIRASGSRNVARSPAVQSALADAESYLRRYSYQRLSASEQMIYEKPLLLKATFDKQSIVSLLKSASLPIWSEDRPAGLFWIAFDNGQERRIVSEQTQLMAAGLEIAAQSRGLPVTLPLVDIDDQMALETSDVWSRLETPIEAASKRYANDYWVAVSMSKETSQWQATWKVKLYGKVQSFSTSGLTSYEAMQGGVNRIADILAGKLAVVLSDQAQEIMISVENIIDFESYASVQKFLNSLGMVRSASAIEVSQDRVLFKVESLTAPQSLIEAIKLGNNLQLSEPSYGYSNVGEQLTGDFHFVWRQPGL
ncbi:DUF2066 domain-containing protein [Kangiella marina]|uniref:DUF2066 domain-containing protein n=1 Tax=Kangiella marina TaxID=1079178 RepID=A0ABP8IP61_9GAMM